MKNLYRERWNNLLEKDNFPSFFKKLQILDFKEFYKIVNDMGEKGLDLINSAFSGDALIIKNVFDRDVLLKLKNDMYEIEKKEKEQNYKIFDNCPNFHISNKQKKLTHINKNYKQKAHSHFFFRWNKDKLKIFKCFDKIWEPVKLLSGLNKNEFKKNTPKDKIIDRIEVLRYPLNEGYISNHIDLCAWQKINIGICLYEPGKDFSSGGVYLMDKNKNKIMVDESRKIQLGDCLCWIPSILHGVEIPKLKGNVSKDWNSIKGRWQAVALSVQSHYVKNRILTTGYETFIKNPLKYQKIYRKLSNNF
jgi:hypothetical protein|tara:strand:+ start:140 stop:1054 length:915 start_codon:yes stop_codon:yes gene_type:complete